MTDENSSGNNQDAPDLAQMPPYVIHAQYVKDFSFENKGILPYLRGEVTAKIQHNMEWALSIDNLEEENYEIILRLNIEGTSGETPMYIIEAFYGAVVSINPAYMEHVRLINQVEIPTLIFPFARQLVADTMIKANYPVLYIPTIDFRNRYLKQMEEEKQQQNS